MTVAVDCQEDSCNYCFLCFNAERTPENGESSSSPENELLALTCRHGSCRSCFAKWMGKFYFSEPTCPFCRATFTDSDRMQILQLDEDTFRYMNEHTCFCPSCGCRVDKLAHEADEDTMCLCGYDFCYDDMKDEGMEPVRDRNNGQVNFRYTLRRREVRRERNERYYGCMRREYLNAEWLFLRSGADIRAMNQLFARDLITERRYDYHYGNDDDDELELPATWLFLRSGADIRAMNQIFSGDSIRDDRILCYYSNQEPSLHAAWLFLRRGADVHAMHHLLMQDEDRVEFLRWDRRRRHREELERRQKERECWLLRCHEEWRKQEKTRQREELERKVQFAQTKKRERQSFLVYQQQEPEWKQRTNMGTRRCAIRCEREERRREHLEQKDLNLSWLFLPIGSDVRAMNQFFVRDNVRKIRQDWRHEVELEYELQNFQSCCECLLDIWEMDKRNSPNDENAVEPLPMKWMGQREHPVKKKRGGRKTSKKPMLGTKESTAKPNARWKRREDHLSWAQD